MSWLIAMIGIIAWRLTVYEGRRKQIAYVLCIINQVIWIVYAAATAQHGFILGAVVGAAVASVNLYQMRRGA